MLRMNVSDKCLGNTLTEFFNKMCDRQTVLVAHLPSRNKCVRLPVFLANLACLGLLLPLLLC